MSNTGICFSPVWAVQNRPRKTKADGYKTSPFDSMVSNYWGIIECIKNDLEKSKIAISLGNACFSAVWAVQNGLRKTKADGYKTCPFDLMVSNYWGVVECIQNDFEDFCNPEFLKLEPHGLYNKKYDFTFNHETPGHGNLHLHENWPEGKNHFINNNFKHFIERYKKRIMSFKEYLSRTDITIVFIIQFSSDKNNDPEFKQLKDALKKKYPNLKYEIKELPK